MQVLLKHIATLGPIGYIPFAPGTFGTVAGLICVLLIPLSPQIHFVFFATVAIIGSFAATAAETEFGQKDSSRIIIDEFAGFLVATLYVPHSPLLLTSAFIIFRFFDILKPLMIHKLEITLNNGLAVMADDILAGIYTNIVLQAYIHLVRTQLIT
ncbi:MAG TPA: phosphatidylglycerophosphatase A [Thermodesulfovibrionales bacterium]|nr:phosphatidylglycerophosphatase A [Thermodesulfovibrionales bacterium]